jgi:hypothetical protein
MMMISFSEPNSTGVSAIGDGYSNPDGHAIATD